jgi:hypothetical protein
MYKIMQSYLQEQKNQPPIVIRFHNWMLEKAQLLLVQEEQLFFPVPNEKDRNILYDYVDNHDTGFEYVWNSEGVEVNKA